MSTVLTAGGIQKVVSMSMEDEVVPITVQLIEINVVPSTLSGEEHVTATFSDGQHFYRMMLAKRLSSLVKLKELRWGDIVTIHNYIMQPLSNDMLGCICLDLLVVGHNDSVIGSPVEFVPPKPSCIANSNFVGVTSEGLCSDCQQSPCDWSVFGPSVVQLVRDTHGNKPNVEKCLLNRSCRHAAYTTFARVKFGYLGKGKRVPLPACVVNGIRMNFPDESNFYVGFIPAEQSDE